MTNNTNYPIGTISFSQIRERRPMLDQVSQILFMHRFKEFVGNRFFTVLFLKKDGTERVMTCRLNVKKHSKGGKQFADPQQYMVGWETTAKNYRNINIETLQWVRCRGIELDLAA
jgi:hypothetical protein